MLHPLVKLLATRPDLVADHADAYLDLAEAEVSDTLAQLRLRALLTWCALALAASGLLLAGIALLLAAALPTEGMPMPWLLAVVPGAAWAGALGCLIRIRTHTPLRPFASLREQLRLDAALLKEAGQ